MGEAPFIVLQAPLGDSLQWLSFRDPVATLLADEISEVLPLLREIDSATERGLWAAGFLSYEAAPAFDAAMRVRAAGDLPLAWFGLFEKPEFVELPTESLPSSRLPGQWEPTVSESDYQRAIESIHRAISRGDTYQINYTFSLEAPFEGDARSLFGALVRGQRSRCCAFVDIGRWALCSASPELFFRLEDERLLSRPMKGTAPRGRTLEEDERSAAWLQASPKNRAENVMIVDMMRHDLGRIATPGSVEVTDLWQLEKYPSLFQLTSTVEARTQAPLSEIFQALFPCASITGAPKIRAMETIADLETHPRGAYTGAIGYAAPGRKARFNVAIRTVQVDRHAGLARFGTGGGIVAESMATEEWEEARTKALVLGTTVPEFRLLETIRWDPEEGFSLLERHLSRLARSAEYFNFELQSGLLEGRLQKASGEWPREVHRVRLLVDSSGEPEIEAEPLSLDDQVWKLALARHPVDRRDRFLFHKTTHRDVYDSAASAFPDHDDVVLWNEEGEVTETTIANLVLRKDGKLLTPALDSGLLPGTLREELLAEERLHERVVTIQDLQSAEEIFLINSVRGWIPAILDLATLETHEGIPA
jgi:para-aminobenzoate synthetase/4-amino-4-deoxychorismate lyase